MAVHIYPIEDWIEHNTEGDHLTCTCLCEPRFECVVELDGDGDPHTVCQLVLHNRVGPELAKLRWYRRWWLRVKEWFKPQPIDETSARFYAEFWW